MVTILRCADTLELAMQERYCIRTRLRVEVQTAPAYLPTSLSCFSA
jgi:hypothetical protein